VNEIIAVTGGRKCRAAKKLSRIGKNIASKIEQRCVVNRCFAVVDKLLKAFRIICFMLLWFALSSNSFPGLWMQTDNTWWIY